MTRVRRLQAALLAIAGLALGGVSAELLVRAMAAVLPGIHALFRGSDPLAILVRPHGVMGYRQKPGAVFHYGNGTSAVVNAMGYRGPEVVTPKPPGTFRILLLGGSTSHGWYVENDSTIDAFMRRVLADRYPGRRFEVVNLAFDGYDSWQDFERLRTDGMRLEPDLVILNSGINDVRNARYPNLVDQDPRTLLWAADMQRLRQEEANGGPSLWTMTKHYFYVARLGGILHDHFPARRPRPGQPAPRIAAFPEAQDYFQRNVERVAGLTTAARIPLMLSTPPSALSIPTHTERTSHQSYWLQDDSATQAYRDALDARLRRVADSLTSAGQPALYVPHHFTTFDLFLDDCHLTPLGNHRMAEDFVAAAAPWLTPAASRVPPRR